MASSASSVTLKSGSARSRETKLLSGVATGPAGQASTRLMTAGVTSSCWSSRVMFRGGILSMACRWYSQMVLLAVASAEKTSAQRRKRRRQR